MTFCWIKIWRIYWPFETSYFIVRCMYIYMYIYIGIAWVFRMDRGLLEATLFHIHQAL
jgi:hypothetical protein